MKLKVVYNTASVEWVLSSKDNFHDPAFWHEDIASWPFDAPYLVDYRPPKHF